MDFHYSYSLCNSELSVQRIHMFILILILTLSFILYTHVFNAEVQQYLNRHREVLTKLWLHFEVIFLHSLCLSCSHVSISSFQLFPLCILCSLFSVLCVLLFALCSLFFVLCSLFFVLCSLFFVLCFLLSYPLLN